MIGGISSYRGYVMSLPGIKRSTVVDISSTGLYRMCAWNFLNCITRFSYLGLRYEGKSEKIAWIATEMDCSWYYWEYKRNLLIENGDSFLTVTHRVGAGKARFSSEPLADDETRAGRNGCCRMETVLNCNQCFISDIK